jgi:hypothetical protein
VSALPDYLAISDLLAGSKPVGSLQKRRHAASEYTGETTAQSAPKAEIA